MPLSLGRSKSTNARSSLATSSSSPRGRKPAPPPPTPNRLSGSFLGPQPQPQPQSQSPTRPGPRARSYETSSRRPRPVSPPDNYARPPPLSRRDSRRPGRSVSPRPRPPSPRRAARVPPRRQRRDSSISDDSRPSSRRPSLSPSRAQPDRLARPPPDYRRASLSPSRFPTEHVLRQEPPLSTHQRPVPPRAHVPIPTAARPHPAKPVRPSPLAGSRNSSYEYDSIPHVMHSSATPSGLSTPVTPSRPRMHDRGGSSRSNASHQSKDHSPRRPLFGEIVDDDPRKHERSSKPPSSSRPHSPKAYPPGPHSPRSEHPPKPERSPKPDLAGKPDKAGTSAKPATQASPKASTIPPKGRTFWGRIPGTFATFAGFQALAQHADDAKEWADWLKDIRDAPEEMHSLSAKAQTAKDTITQIQNTLEARPDLVEGESGKRLRDQIEGAIKSTNGVLSEQTRILQELGETTANNGSVLSGIQEFWNSYKYRSEWEGKIKAADGALKDELSGLSTLMINLYSRAMMKPPPPGFSNNGPPPAPQPRETRAADASGTKTASTSGEKPTTDEKPEATTSPTSAGLDPPPMPQMPKNSPGSRSIPHSPERPKKPDEEPSTKPPSTPPLPTPEPAPNSDPRSKPPDQDPKEALLDAAWNGDVDAVASLTLTTPITTTDSKGYTPLHLAAERDNLATALLLLDRGASPNARTLTGRTPLHLAARYASSSTVELLVDDGKADVNARTAEGRTPLHYAASSAADGDEERREVVRVLRDWGADPTVVDGKGCTARECAQKRDFWDVSSTLRRAEKKWEEDHPQSWFRKHGFRK